MRKCLNFNIVASAVAALAFSACGGDTLPAAGDSAVSADGTDDALAIDGGSDASPTDVASDDDAPRDAETDAAPDAAVDAESDAESDAQSEVGEDAQTDVSVDTGPGKCTGEQIKACSDNLACTTDKCSPGGTCSWSLSDGWCFINGACIASGESKPGDPCFTCDPVKSSKAWSPSADGKSCDDGNLCTYEGKCQNQKCVSKPTPCGDNNPCTGDICDPKQGCLYPPVVSGYPCDDGNACTLGDGCTETACKGQNINCNDGNPCTDDSCDMASGCTHTNHEGTCTDGDECTAGDSCVSGKCQKGTAKNCDDGNTCTIDQCYPKQAGGCYHLAKQSACCTGVTSVCDDGNPCTNDDCDPATSGCNHSDNSAACDDGSACTSGDTCAGGGCAGSAIACTDNNPCTSDSCDKASGCVYLPIAASSCDDNLACTDDFCDPKSGCSHSNNTASCEDGDSCTTGDACKDGSCKAGGPKNCDDGNVCTFDQCYPNTADGCYHLATKSPCCIGVTSICDDGNTCTNDDCDPKTSACLHSNNSAPCTDGSACTGSDNCKDGTCGGITISCDDGNPCSTDACDPKNGCAHGTIDGGACDDGSPCTTGDVCSAGKCVGQGQCTCEMTFSDQASKFTSLQIGAGGTPGEGLDVDADPKTCAPADSCTGGIDNSLSNMGALVNSALQKSVVSGSVDFVLEYRDLKQGAIVLGLYTAKVDAVNPTCDFQTQTCDYDVAKSLIDYTLCLPKVLFNGKLAGDVIEAGGKGTNFPFSLPITGAVLNIVIYNAVLHGTVTFDAGGKIATFDGVLGGAVPKATLLAAIDAVPDASLPLPKDTLKALIDGSVVNDIDSNGDGTLDAASIGLKLHGIQAVISGTY